VAALPLHRIRRIRLFRSRLTGTARRRGSKPARLSQLTTGRLSAVSASKRLVYGLGATATSSAIISISTPRACWS
jgi:hypothetical protein